MNDGSVSRCRRLALEVDEQAGRHAIAAAGDQVDETIEQVDTELDA